MGEILQFRLPHGKGETRSPGTDTSLRAQNSPRQELPVLSADFQAFASADDPCDQLLDWNTLYAELSKTEAGLSLRVAILTMTDASTDADVTALHSQEAVGQCARALVGGLRVEIETIEWETIQTNMGPRILLAFSIPVPENLPIEERHRVVLRWTGMRRRHAFAFNWVITG